MAPRAVRAFFDMGAKLCMHGVPGCNLGHVADAIVVADAKVVADASVQR
jgi:hypothetical protein